MHKTISLGASMCIAFSAQDHKQRLESMVSAKVLVFLIALSPFALEAADWVQISSDYESSIYYDRDSLKREGDMVEVVLLWDFPDVQLTRRPVKPYLSATRLTRYRCGAGIRAMSPFARPARLRHPARLRTIKSP